MLYVVDPDAAPPSCGAMEDWIRAPLERDELYARADLLLARAQRLGPVHVGVDADGVLWVDDRLVILSPTEALVMGHLVHHLERVVPRCELAQAIWPGSDVDVRPLAKHVASLRRKIGHLPLEIHAVRSQGLLLERVAGR